jgi:hypothetical protein
VRRPTKKAVPKLGNKGSRPAGIFRLSVDWKRENGASAPGSLARAADDTIKDKAPLSQGVEQYEDQDV